MRTLLSPAYNDARRKLVGERAENLQKDYMHDLCLPLGPGYATGADSTGAEMIKIVQTPALIVTRSPMTTSSST